jgi:hypothetical protein
MARTVTRLPATRTTRTGGAVRDEVAQRDDVDALVADARQARGAQVGEGDALERRPGRRARRRDRA